MAASDAVSAPSQTQSPEATAPAPGATELRRGLKSRHIHFIALGSAIGTGLFYGSSTAISLAGPAVLLAYLVGGFVVYLMLHALGEMAVADPTPGSFAEYARRYLGGWAGFLTGWTYAIEMLLVCLADVTAFAIYMGFWFPGVDKWVWVAGVIAVIAVANLVQVAVFGELEFGFSFIKVAAIIAMIIGGTMLIIGSLGDPASTVGVDNLWNHGGFLPHGFSGLALAFVFVMFAFGGTEIIGITAGEAQNPRVTIPKAVNAVPFRILVFYVLSILVILVLNPWTEITGESSPFVQIFSDLGISWAAHLLNVVIITAALSAINSDIFGTGRVLYGLSHQGLAPRLMQRVARNGVPVMTVAFMVLTLVVGSIINYLFPEGLFTSLAVLATFATVFVWFMILLSHLAWRARLSPEERDQLQFKVPLGLPGQWFAVVVVASLFVIIYFLPDDSGTLPLGIGWLAALTAIYALMRYAGRRRAAAAMLP